MGPSTDKNRHLNPALFGDQPVLSDPASVMDPRSPASSVMGTLPDLPNRANPYPPVDFRALEGQVKMMRSAILQLEKRTETIAFKMEELARSVHGRLERFGQTLTSFSEAQNKNAAESAQRFANVVAKVNERKVTDMKIQDMMDRHNTIVRNFENRLTSLQRLVNEQEMSLHNAQAALEESRAEIARLMNKR
jgi:hypothetical protein